MTDHWYLIDDIDNIDSPALIVYKERVLENIRKVIEIVGNTQQLRPHVKTHKMEHVCKLMLQEGITKLKCATIAEVEMLAVSGATDILLAYQPVGPKIIRLFKLIKAFPKCRISCVVDNVETARLLNILSSGYQINISVFIDLNVGMNRTGIQPENALNLVESIQSLKHLNLAGIHAYDGHIHHPDLKERKAEADQVYSIVNHLAHEIKSMVSHSIQIVIGGTPTFSMHALHNECEVSPGTFVFWDWGYKHKLAELPFEYAALIITRVISIVDDHHICIDLGYKSVASESPLPRIYFINAPETVPIGHSEEHMVLEVPDSKQYEIGQIFYGVPKHICPTVALYEQALVVENNHISDNWQVTARNRIINY